MAANLCSLVDVLANNSCKPNYAGVGSRVYLFKREDMDGVIPQYSDAKPEFRQDAFNALQGKLVAVDIKEFSGQVTSTMHPEGSGFSNVGTFTVVKGEETYSQNLRTMNGAKMGALIYDGKGAYYVLYSDYQSTSIENSGDTGTTADSDHGQTTTITADPMEIPMVRWRPVSNGKITIPTNGSLYYKVGDAAASEVDEGDVYYRTGGYFTDSDATIPAIMGVDFDVDTENATPINLDDWLASANS